MLAEKTLNIYSFAREEGEKFWFLGLPTFLKAAGEQTGGVLGLVEQIAPVGFESPYHLHRREEEIFFVLEGELSFISGEERIIGSAGSYTFLPREIPHGFKVTGTNPARFFILSLPAGLEQFFFEMGDPTPSAGPPDMGKLMSVADKYGLEILGPLPE